MAQYNYLDAYHDRKKDRIYVAEVIDGHIHTCNICEYVFYIIQQDHINLYLVIVVKNIQQMMAKNLEKSWWSIFTDI